MSPKGDGWPAVVPRARAYVAAQFPLSCLECGEPVDGTEPWVVAHIEARWKRPDLIAEPSNWGAEHRVCSDRTGRREQLAAQRQRNGQQRRPLGPHKGLTSRDSRQTTTARFSGAAPSRAPADSSSDTRPSREISPPFDEFEPKSLADASWLSDLVDCPADAAWPLAMTGIKPGTIGSLGLDAERWIADEIGVELRWWQRLALRRQLEIDESGCLVWLNVLESTPRRAGKSVRLRCTALWRTSHAEQFGETQLVLHTGKDLPICKEIHRKAWRWAEQRGWVVRRQNGNEEIEAPDESRWLVRGKSSVYGYDVTMPMIDEAWAVDATTVDDGLEPAMLERLQPQLVLTSTAHRRATSMMRRRLDTALLSLDGSGDTLCMLWGAREGADLDDERVWRAASPHWSDHRRSMIAGKLARARAGEIDPDADDPDPLEAFKAQYLNIWPASNKPRVAPGDPVVTEAMWGRLRSTRPPGRPTVCAIESHYSLGVCAALAWPLSDERVHVEVTAHATLVDALRAALRERPDVVLAGKSLAKDPAFVGTPVEPVTATTRQIVVLLRRLIGSDLVRHSSDVLDEQVLDLRVVEGPEGPKLRSSGRVDGVKAAVWAIERARVAGERPAIW